ncbi:SLC4A1AP, partial [Cordylochernes scorpioides]
MVETRSGKMQDPAQERIKAEEAAKPQLGATIYISENMDETSNSSQAEEQPEFKNDIKQEEPEEFKVPTIEKLPPDMDKTKVKLEPKGSIEASNLTLPKKPEKETLPLPYKEPKWSGVSEEKYSFEVLKNGLIIHQIDLTKSPYIVFGRLENCDVSLEHPSISRYHAIVQYKVSDDDSKGYYIYDLGSTHGTFVNKLKIAPKVYVRLKVGYVIKFGGSTRMFILQGPEEDEEPESELTVTEIKELARKRIEELKAKAEEPEEKEEEENAGIDWGMADDAEEIISENPFALNKAAEELNLEDPKKTLRGWFEREGCELEYKVEEIGPGHFSCRIELPISDDAGAPIFAEAALKGKKKDVNIACALEACRILDQHGLLQQAHHEGRQKKRNWEETDFYASDEDTFLDRTGTIEMKRIKRKLAANKLEVETYDTVKEKLETFNKEIEDIERKLAEDKASADVSTDDNADSLDIFLKTMKTGSSLDKATRSKLKMDLAELKQQRDHYQILAEKVQPTKLPPLEPKPMVKNTAKDFKFFIGKRKGGSSVSKPIRPQVKVPVPAQQDTEDIIEEEDLPSKPTEIPEKEQMEVEMTNIPSSSENIKPPKQIQSKPSTQILEERSEQNISEKQEDKTTKQTIINQPDDKNTEQKIETPSKHTDQSAQKEEKRKESPVSEEQTKKKPKRQRPNKKKVEVGATYDGTDPDYVLWLPPDDQKGDGRKAAAAAKWQNARQQETADQRAERLQRDSEAKRLKLDNETAEQRAARLLRKAETSRSRFDNETAEQRAARLLRKAETSRSRIDNETAEQRAARLLRKAETSRSRIDNETAEQSAARLLRKAETSRSRIDNETAKQHAARLLRKAETSRSRIDNETAEQRAARLLRKAETSRSRIDNETAEQHAARLLRKAETYVIDYKHKVIRPNKKIVCDKAQFGLSTYIIALFSLCEVHCVKFTDRICCRMVETSSGKMQDPAQERIKAEEAAKPQLGAIIYISENMDETSNSSQAEEQPEFKNDIKQEEPEEFKVPTIEKLPPDMDKTKVKLEPKGSIEASNLTLPKKPEKETLPLPYKEPKWSGVSEEKYSFEVLKNGLIINQIDLTKSPYIVFGRLENCDVSLEHPSISRYHAIVQYKVSDDDSKGYYIYDLGSTHGTFVNKLKIAPKVYVRLKVGYVIKFGGSTRMFILQGPEEDEEPESELTVTEIKELARKRIEELKAKAEEPEEKEEEENAGIDWGMADDAEEIISENPFALNKAAEELNLEDPKKTLRGWFEREGCELEYKVEEIGPGHFSCRIELPISDDAGAPIFAEAALKGKKKDVNIACALEACRILDQHGLLRQAHHEGRQKKRNWEETDFYASDEDTFLDRTGTIEKKRIKRKLAANKLEVETYDTVKEKLETFNKEIEDIERKLAEDKASADVSTDDNADSLDIFLKTMKTGSSLDKATRSKLKMDLAELKQQRDHYQILAEKVQPTKLPPLEPKPMVKNTAKDFKFFIGKRKGGSSVSKPIRPQVKVPVPAQQDTEDIIEEEDLPSKPTEIPEKEQMEVEMTNIPSSSENIKPPKQIQSKPSTQILEERSEQNISEKQEDKTTKQTIINQPDDKNTEQKIETPSKHTDQSAQKEEKRKESPVSEEQTKKKPKRQRPNKKKVEVGATYDGTDPDYVLWLPPDDQKGDWQKYNSEEERKAAAAAKRQNARQQETADQRAERLQRDSEAKRLKLDNETAEQRAARLLRKAETSRSRIDNETAEQRAARLLRKAETSRSRIDNETAEQRAARLLRKAETSRSRIDNETAEQSAARLLRKAETSRSRIDNETAEQHAARLLRKAETSRSRIDNETAEQRAARLLRKAETSRSRIDNETAEQSAARLLRKAETSRSRIDNETAEQQAARLLRKAETYVIDYKHK